LLCPQFRPLQLRESIFHVAKLAQGQFTLSPFTLASSENKIKKMMWFGQTILCRYALVA
jgi:hypothetical protein